MLNKATTATGIFFFGLASLGNATTTSGFPNVPVPNLDAIELECNSPKTFKSRVDNYIESKYKMEQNLANKYSTIEHGFLNSVQKFANDQIELDQEFSAALDELLLSKINSKPTKIRF